MGLLKKVVSILVREKDKFVQIFQTHLFAKFKQAQRTWFADISQFIFVKACFEPISFLF